MATGFTALHLKGLLRSLRVEGLPGLGLRGFEFRGLGVWGFGVSGFRFRV